MALGLDTYGIAPMEGHECCYFLFCPDGRELKFVWKKGMVMADELTRKQLRRPDVDFIYDYFENNAHI